MKRVVVTASLPGDALDGLEGRARVRVLNSRGILSESTLQKALRSADGAVTIPSDPVSERVLEGCPRLKVVANCAVGTDNIDLEAARRLGIAVTNTPDVLNEATADLTWALILGVARRTAEGDRLLRRRRFRGWKPDFLLGVDLGGKTLGIVGMGRIGRAVARRAAAFGMRVIYSQRTRLPVSVEDALGARFFGLDDLLARSDVVSLHCPLTDATRHLLDAGKLASMKKSAILVNTGRGPLVDEDALVACLSRGHLFGAGLDVFEREPLLAPGLAALPNVLLLPHVGSAGAETRAAMARLAVADCLAVLESREPAHRVV